MKKGRKSRIQVDDLDADVHKSLTDSDMRRITGGDGAASALFQATQTMQEMNMSYNLQYLQLQGAMQQENRQFTLVSNIMKTKHDTAKSAINNVR